MAFIQYATGINYVKGALAKPKKGLDGHKCGNYFIGTHREAPTSNPNCTRAYIRAADGYDRTTPISADERAQREKFSQISKGVALRKQDLAKVATDLAAFNAQKDEPNGYKTLKQYLWHVVAGELNG